ncbi:ninja-family protein 6-like [Canna indica]|uniref:Ninja-family protein n=1 Tax=Canna indica TaxID=4628 RepID=A0AAQ3JLT1_9LILI|nr:ninja-family protein 6-like [Canna indica]
MKFSVSSSPVYHAMEDDEAEGKRKVSSSGKERLPRDFLRRFVGNAYHEPMEATEGDSDEIELSLGLSLGGSFHADAKGKKLGRSSSTVSFSSLLTEPEIPIVVAAALTRTSSLPAEIEEEQRKRKEMQSLKRLEAKRKRIERRNSIRSGAAKAGGKLDLDGKESVPLEHMMLDNGQHGLPEGNHFEGARNGVCTPPGLPTWGAASKRAAEAPGFIPPISQVSIGSQGSSSIGACDFDHRPSQEAKSSAIATAISHSQASGVGKLEKQAAAAKANASKETERRMMERMPFVSTRGDGPNGKRIEGFLYKYRKGEEVRIVCVCHGSFLTPAEFVKHAGGGDVVNPLRHIVVNSSPFSLL